MQSWVQCNTPVIISKDKSYVETMTIDRLFRNFEEENIIYTWTPYGWERIKYILTKEATLEEIIIIKNAKNFLICSESCRLLCSDFIHSQTWFNIVNSNENFKQIHPEIQALIWEYTIPVIESIMAQNMINGLYEVEFPESKIINVETLVSNKEADVDIETGISCDVCDASVDGTYYNCIECSKELDDSSFDLCPLCFNHTEFKETQHTSSHSMTKIEKANRMDYYNAIDTSSLQHYLYMKISHDLCYNCFSDKEIHDIPSIRWSGDIMQIQYHRHVMEFEKLGYKDYELNLELSSNYSSMNLMMNFYPLLMIKYRTLFCHDTCYKIKPKDKYDEKKNVILKNFKKDIKKIYAQYKNQTNSIETKKIEIHKIADLKEIQHFRSDFGFDQKNSLYTIVTRSGLWTAGIGKFVLYNS